MDGCTLWETFCTSHFDSNSSSAVVFPGLCTGALKNVSSSSGGGGNTTTSEYETAMAPAIATNTAATTSSSSSSGGSDCIKDPTQASCASYEMSEDNAEKDLAALCASMPNMVGCSLWSQCTTVSW